MGNFCALSKFATPPVFTKGRFAPVLPGLMLKAREKDSSLSTISANCGLKLGGLSTPGCGITLPEIGRVPKLLKSVIPTLFKAAMCLLRDSVICCFTNTPEASFVIVAITGLSFETDLFVGTLNLNGLGITSPQ
jgi:hypothetical protein